MTGSDPHRREPGSKVGATGGLHVAQFSLATLFVITTATALILAVFFTVGRLLGMSNMDVVEQGLVRLLYAVPTLLVWIVGMTLAFQCLKQNRLPATLTLIALGGMALTTVVFQLVQMVLIHSVTSNGLSGVALSWGFAIVGIFHAIFNTGCWILILVAIFAQRLPHVSETERSDGSFGAR